MKLIEKKLAKICIHCKNSEYKKEQGWFCNKKNSYIPTIGELYKPRIGKDACEEFVQLEAK